MTELSTLIPTEPTFTGLKLGKQTREALEIMAREGVTLADAADRVEMRRANLQRAFDSPNVRQRFNAVTKWIRDNEAQAAYLRISELAKNSDSAHVRLEANKWLCGVDGIAPLKRVESRHNHRHTFAGFDYGEPPKDITGDE